MWSCRRGKRWSPVPPGWQNHSVSVFFYSFWGLCFSIFKTEGLNCSLFLPLGFRDPKKGSANVGQSFRKERKGLRESRQVGTKQIETEGKHLCSPDTEESPLLNLSPIPGWGRGYQPSGRWRVAPAGRDLS